MSRSKKPSYTVRELGTENRFVVATIKRLSISPSYEIILAGKDIIPIDSMFRIIPRMSKKRAPLLARRIIQFGPTDNIVRLDGRWAKPPKGIVYPVTLERKLPYKSPSAIWLRGLLIVSSGWKSNPCFLAVAVDNLSLTMVYSKYRGKAIKVELRGRDKNGGNG